MGKSKDKKALWEAKAGKKLALEVKRKQLKRKKDRVLDGAVENECAVKHTIMEDKEPVRSKKLALTKQQQQKKNKHAKVKGSSTKADKVVELLSVNKDETTLRLKKKKNKKMLLEGSNSVEVEKSLSDNNEVGIPKMVMKKKKNKKKSREGKSSAGSTDEEEIQHGNQNEETLIGQSEVMDIEELKEVKGQKKDRIKEVKKSGRKSKKDKHASDKENKLERLVEFDTANVDEIPFVDVDSSRGMKKWILEYKRKRPGLKVLQQRIDEFISAHEEKQEEERKEREARAAEDGWTVVAHHKGRKKSTDTETGTAVGSVSLAAMQEKMANKKPKEADLNFYRFQRREAQINELAMLRSKFEQDKKRIQQIRAQRKFKPY